MDDFHILVCSLGFVCTLGNVLRRFKENCAASSLLPQALAANLPYGSTGMVPFVSDGSIANREEQQPNSELEKDNLSNSHFSSSLARERLLRGFRCYSWANENI